MADEESSADKENSPPKKKRKVSLSLCKRFKRATEEELETLSFNKMPKNTEASTKWSIKNFTDWFHGYNSRNPDNKCPDELLLPTCSIEVLNKWLCVYAAETRSHTGQEYPPATIHSLLSGIFRHMKAQNSEYPNFMDKNNGSFNVFNTTLDNLYKRLRSEGVGATSKHTEGISKEEEDQLWSCGVLNTTTPLGLLRAVFFYNGKCFCLRGGQEHRDLKLSQLQRETGPDRYVYTENASKNRKGGLRELRLEHKVVPVIADPEAGVRCHVYLLDLYIGKLPSEAVMKDLFYCRPLQKISELQPWYSAVPVGRNMLNQMVALMCENAGIAGKKTNHSLRVTGATALFDAGVPERIIQSRTGHKSVEALRLYERVTNDQVSMVSKVLSGSADHFDKNTKGTVADVKPPAISTDADDKDIKPAIVPVKPTNPTAGNYYNCTVNMFNGPQPPPYYYQPWQSHSYSCDSSLSYQFAGNLPEDKEEM